MHLSPFDGAVVNVDGTGLGHFLTSFHPNLSAFFMSRATDGSYVVNFDSRSKSIIRMVKLTA